jgi:hypothetical protein
MPLSHVLRSACAAGALLLAAGAHAQDRASAPSALDDFVRMSQANPPRPAQAPPIGFGMRKTGTSADNWISHFAQWLQASRLMAQ